MPYIIMHHVASLDREHVVSTHKDLERAQQYVRVFNNTLPTGDYLYIVNKESE